MSEKEIINRLHNLGIEELRTIQTLNVLSGDYVNNMCKCPNGTKNKLLDDNSTYLCAQVEIEGSERCYGVAADEHQIAVFSYGCNGTECELEIWLKR